MPPRLRKRSKRNIDSQHELISVDELVVYIDTSAGTAEQLEHLKEALIHHGATVKSRMSSLVTHVVVDNDSTFECEWSCQVLTLQDILKLLPYEKKKPRTGVKTILAEEIVNDDISTNQDDKASKALIVKEIRKGRASVDVNCPVHSVTHVYEESQCVYDAMLNQTNINRNNNKFYLIQLLESDHRKDYFLWRRWGRVGYKGQTELVNCQSLTVAKSLFLDKYMSKTGNEWNTKAPFEIIPGKYVLMERDFGGEVPETRVVDRPNVPSKLNIRVQGLITLIFDVSMMSRCLVEIGYDANKMPLGKLTKTHIQKGYEILTKLAQLMNKKVINRSKMEEITSRFYTLIPHDFGRSRPPVIDSSQALGEKLKLLESLADVEIATTLIESSINDLRDVHVLDHYYSSLSNDIVPVDEESDTWLLIQRYLDKTHAPTHDSYKLEILNIFETSRFGESENFSNLHNRMLLWHGSRLLNFVGILSQGLRIAPKEAPSTGYMFGKGIYFSDVVSKSANYCNCSPESPDGLLILCEVALGDCLELNESNYNAKNELEKSNGHSVKGCGETIPDPKEFITVNQVTVPAGRLIPTGQKSELLYNEYIVYKTDQIKMKYIVKVKFKYCK